MLLLYGALDSLAEFNEWVGDSFSIPFPRIAETLNDVIALKGGGTVEFSPFIFFQRF